MSVKKVWAKLRRKPERPVAFPYEQAGTSKMSNARELSLWDQAFRQLERDNPALVSKYENQLQLVIKSEDQVQLATKSEDDLQLTTRSEDREPTKDLQALTNKEHLDQVIAFGLGKMEEERLRLNVQENLAKAAQVVEWAKTWIDQAVQASPQASIAWSIISLGIPFLTYPATAEETCKEGFSYTVSRMDYYLAVESKIMNLGTYNTSAIIDFYKAILEYQIRCVLRFYRASLETFVRDVLQAEDWKGMLESLKTTEEQLYRNTLQTSSLMVHEQLTNLLKAAELKNEKMNLLTCVNQEQLQIQKSILDNIVESAMQLKITRKEEQQRFNAADKEECLQELRLVDSQLGPDQSYEMYKKRNALRVEGTCLWFTNHPHFQEWMKERFGPLFVTADPGCGKSVLAAYLIDNVLDEPVCYFFFKDAVKNRMHQALCALLHQIFSSKPSLIDFAMPLWERNGRGLMTNNVLLWQLFCQVIDHFDRPATIVLDGLDECDLEDRTILLTDLAGYLDDPRAKFLLTSRPYQQITGKFQSLVEEYPTIRIPGENLLHEISPEIDIVVEARVTQLAKELQLQPHIKDHIQARLLEVPQRTYLWVYLVLDYLKDGFKRTPTGVDHLLGQLPTSINNAYEKMLQRCGPPNKPTIARIVFEILLAAKNTMRLDQLQMALEVRRNPGIQNIAEIDIEDSESFTQTLRRECGLMVSILDRQVYFLHQTVREFLLGSVTDKKTWHGSFDLISCNNTLASICIDYINLDRTPLDDGETSDHSSIYDISDPEIREAAVLITNSIKHLPSDLGSAVVSFDVYTECFWKEHYAEYEHHGQSSSTLDHKALRLYGASRTSISPWNRYPWGETRKNIICFTGATDLMEIVQDQVVRLIPLCLEHTDVNACSPLIGTALHEALWQKSDTMIQRLLDAGASVDVPHPISKETAVHFAVSFAELIFAEQIIRKSTSHDTLDQNGCTPLQIAVENLRPKIVSLLLECDAKTDGIALHAVMEYCVDPQWLFDVEIIVDKCVQHGADINLRDSRGRTVLHSLLYEVRLWHDVIPRTTLTRINNIIQTLVAAGADLEAQDDESYSVEDLILQEPLRSCKALVVPTSLQND